MDPLVQFFAPYPKTEKSVTETEETLTETEKSLTDNEQDVDENELPDYVKYLDLRFPFTLVEHMKRPPLTVKAQNGEESCEHKSEEPENAEPSYDRYATSTQTGILIREYVGDPMGQFVSQNVINQNGNDCFMTSIQKPTSEIHNSYIGRN